MKINEIFATDKLLHLFVGFFLTVFFTAILTAFKSQYPVNAAMLITFAIFIGKEIYDIAKRHSWADSLFDLGFGTAGAGLALFCIAAIA